MKSRIFKISVIALLTLALLFPVCALGTFDYYTLL